MPWINKKIKKIRKLSSLKKYKDSFGEFYEGIRYNDREVAIERLSNGRIRICLCLPYEKDEDKESGIIGKGAGEVLASWVAENEEDAVEITNNGALTPVRLDKIKPHYE